MRRDTHGTTLIEVIVAVAILGVLAALSATQLRTSWVERPTSPSDATADDMSVALDSVAAVRLRAIEARRLQRAIVAFDGRPRLVSALPDGSVFIDGALPMNRLTGQVSDAWR